MVGLITHLNGENEILELFDKSISCAEVVATTDSVGNYEEAISLVVDHYQEGNVICGTEILLMRDDLTTMLNNLEEDAILT